MHDLASLYPNWRNSEVEQFGVDGFISFALFAPSVMCAVAGRNPPQGFFHLDRMLKPLVRRGEVGCCGTCMDTRGLKEAALVAGVRRSTLEELADWVLWADRALNF